MSELLLYEALKSAQKEMQLDNWENRGCAGGYPESLMEKIEDAIAVHERRLPREHYYYPPGHHD